MLRLAGESKIEYEDGESELAQKKHKEGLDEVARFLSEGGNYIVFVQVKTGIQVRSCIFAKDQKTFIPVLKHAVGYLEALEDSTQ